MTLPMKYNFLFLTFHNTKEVQTSDYTKRRNSTQPTCIERVWSLIIILTHSQKAYRPKFLSSAILGFLRTYFGSV